LTFSLSNFSSPAKPRQDADYHTLSLYAGGINLFFFKPVAKMISKEEI